MAPKRYAWSVEQKWFAVQLKRTEPTKSLDAIIAAIHVKFGQDLARSTLSQWIKQGDAIEAQYNASGSNEAKRARPAKNPKLEQALFLWYKSHETRGSPISGEVLTAKAKELAARPELEVTEGFNCSAGWLTNFKKRFGISSHQRHGEAGSAPELSVDHAQTKLRVLLSALPDAHGENPVDVQPHNIFTMDETGLYWCQQPSRTLARGKTTGNVKDKKRMTVALVVNATGTEQLRPIIIHTANKPRAFPKGFNVEAGLGVHWHCNRSASMLSTVFQDWITKVNTKMKSEQRNIVMLLDNAPTHIPPNTTKKTLMGFDVYRLSNVTIIFLPANTTSIVQPLDQGIIAAYKAHYRAHLVQHIIHELDSDATMTLRQVKVDAYQAVKWMRHASKALTSDAIRNCWYKSAILGADKVPAPPQRAQRRRLARAGAVAVLAQPAEGLAPDVPEADDAMDEGGAVEVAVEEPSAGMAALAENMAELSRLAARRPAVLEDGDTLLCASEFADLPGEDETFVALEDDEIVALVTSDDAPDRVDELDTDEQVQPEFSLAECVHALELVQVALCANGAITAEFKDKLTDVIDEVERIRISQLKQSSITQCVTQG